MSSLRVLKRHTGKYPLKSKEGREGAETGTGQVTSTSHFKKKNEQSKQRKDLGQNGELECHLELAKPDRV